MRKKHVLTVWNGKKNTLRKIVTWMLRSLSPVGCLLPWLVTVNRGADQICFARKPCFEIASHWKESSIAVQWWTDPVFSSILSQPRNPLSYRHIHFITHNFVNWNNFGAVLVWVGKNTLYHSCKTLPAGKDCFVIEVHHVLLTLSPYISLPKNHHNPA